MVSVKFISNPFYCYAIGFGLVLFVYTWSWSTLYPQIEINVFLFIVSSIAISIVLGALFQKKYVYKDVKVNNYNFLFTSLIIFGYILEFVYNGGVPLFMIFRGDAYSHYDFGIPTFHVFLQTVAPFYMVYLYHQYLSSKNKKLIFYLIILFFIGVLVVNRGSTLMTLMSCLVIYCQKKEFISYKVFFTLIATLVFIFYMFGFIGFARSFKDHEDYLFDMAEAKESFRESIIPGEFFWFYLYASSPIANFQNAVNDAKHIRYNTLIFVGSELIPDFITKRIISPSIDPDKDEGDKYLIANFLTVGSIYYDPYRRMGWFGVVIIFAWLMTLIAFVPLLIDVNKPYFSTVVSILCTMALFSTFDNMIRFTGLSFQLVYPLLFGYLGKYYFKRKKIRLILPRIIIKA